MISAARLRILLQWRTHSIEILEPVLRDDGQEMWQALDRIISAKNAMEGIAAKEMYIRGFLDYERLVCEKDNHI